MKAYWGVHSEDMTKPNPWLASLALHRKRADMVPRGHVLRCTIEDGGGEDGGEAVICIDDKELSAQEFRRMLTVFAGWGMRIAFVPEEDIYEPPQIEVRDPDDAALTK